MFLLILATKFGEIDAFLKSKFKQNPIIVLSMQNALEGNDEVVYKEFSGPKSSLDEMVAGIQNDELGINVVVGPSGVAGE